MCKVACFSFTVHLTKIKKILLQFPNRLIFSLRGVITCMRRVITPAFFVVPEATQGYVNLTVFSSRGHDIVPTIINTPPWPSASHFHGRQLLAASLAPKVSPRSHQQSNPPAPLLEMGGGTRRRGTMPRPPLRS
jgi:hypothetical protein